MKNKYEWNISDGYPEKNGYKVFSCFACGGGSTMGYKLAGFEVVGANDIDHRMKEVYEANHDPDFFLLGSISKIKSIEVLPEEMFNIDILDGSPPCSSFSHSGKRGRYWGKKKKFKEGQAEQILDTLFFDFIDLAARIKPKVIVAENVKGIIEGSAIQYVRRIRKEMDAAGYFCEWFLLDGSNMGLPQKRERVFFIAVRKDICPTNILGGLFKTELTLDMRFDEPEIPFREVRHNYTDRTLGPSVMEVYREARKGETKLREACKRLRGKPSFFSYKIIYNDRVCTTIMAGDRSIVWGEDRFLNFDEIRLISSFPRDYDFCGMDPIYIMGMSVPPVMMQGVADRIRYQILNVIYSK